MVSSINDVYREEIYDKNTSKTILKFIESLNEKNREYTLKLIISDYANHPTEIRYTIKAAKQKYPGKKIITIFEPYTFSKVEKFKNDFIISPIGSWKLCAEWQRFRSYVKYTDFPWFEIPQGCGFT